MDDVSILCQKTLISGKNRLIDILSQKNYMSKLTPYFSNTYNFLYGTAGVLYGLQQFDESIPQDLLDATLEKIKSKDNEVLPSSLSRGKLAPMIVIYRLTLDPNLENKISNLLNCEFSRIAFSKKISFSLDNGLSGIGILSLIMYEITQKEYYLSIPDIIVKIILQQKIILSTFGLAYGNTGVAVFLIKYYKYRKKISILKQSKKYILTDIQKGQLINGKNKLRGIRCNLKSNIPYIYIPYGTAGIIKTTLLYLGEIDDLGLRKELNLLENSLKVSSTLQSGYAFGTAGIISTLNDILKFDKTDPYQVRIYFEKLIRSLLSTGFKMKNQIIFSGDQNFKEFIDYGSGSMGILLTLKKIIDNQEFDPIFKDL